MTTQSTYQGPKKIEEQRFEFLLYINGNIICQRYFHIKGFNDDSVNSSVMLNTHGECVDIIKSHLKNKTYDYLWGYYDPYKTQTDEEIPRTNIWEKEDVFGFEIRIDKATVAYSKFTGNVYPPRVRYQVDIKELIPEIISEIRNGLGGKIYSKKN